MSPRTRIVDTVLFDLDDTLHDDTTAYQNAALDVAAEIERERGIDGRALFEAYRHGVSAFWTALTSEHLALAIAGERERMWYEALRAVGIDDRALAERAAAAYTRARAENLVLPAGSIDVLAALRARGCKLGLVTNGFAETHHDKIDRLGLRDKMDAFFLADEVGMVKPDPALFLHACRVLGSEPARSAMVGDRYARDVVGAYQAGLFTVLLDVHAIPIPEGGPRPDAVIATITDLLGVLPSARQTAD